MKEDACKGLCWNGATRCLQIFGKNPDERLSRIYSLLLQIDCKMVQFKTNIFISIMIEHTFTKIMISKETMMDPCESSLDASLFQMGKMIFFLFWSFPIFVATRSSLLVRILELKEGPINVYSMKLHLASVSFFPEMPACARDDFRPLRLRVRLEQFKQLYVAHVLNHLLCRRAERVVGSVLL